MSPAVDHRSSTTEDGRGALRMPEGTDPGPAGAAGWSWRKIARSIGPEAAGAGGESPATVAGPVPAGVWDGVTEGAVGGPVLPGGPIMGGSVKTA